MTITRNVRPNNSRREAENGRGPIIKPLKMELKIVQATTQLKESNFNDPQTHRPSSFHMPETYPHMDHLIFKILNAQGIKSPQNRISNLIVGG